MGEGGGGRRWGGGKEPFVKIFGGAKGSDEREFEALEICCRCGDRRVLILVGSLVRGTRAWSLTHACSSDGLVDIYSKLSRSLLCMSITRALVQHTVVQKGKPNPNHSYNTSPTAANRPHHAKIYHSLVPPNSNQTQSPTSAVHTGTTNKHYDTITLSDKTLTYGKSTKKAR